MKYSDFCKIGVFGSAAGDNIAKLESRARMIGQEIARRSGILITGGCGGIPLAAALAAKEAGGVVIGISPAMDSKEHQEKYNFPLEPYTLIFTGAGRTMRNCISTRTCDAAIFIAGRTGTLNEFINFYSEADTTKVIGLLKGSGGLVDNFIPAFLKGAEKKTKALIIEEEEPFKLVADIYRGLFLRRS